MKYEEVIQEFSCTREPDGGLQYTYNFLEPKEPQRPSIPLASMKDKEQ